MAEKKQRIRIPSAKAAQVMFSADRTCCVCRKPGKPVQIHHIDDNPANNVLTNLSVLCLDDHELTQIRGGFGRKLDSDQVRLYRDDWEQIVARNRTSVTSEPDRSKSDAQNLEISASLAEIYREKEEWMLLAIHYDSIGNEELRDKYIEIAIKEDPDDSTVTYLRTLQGRSDLIPQAVIKRALRRNKNYDWTARARLLKKLGRKREAIVEYLQGIINSLDTGNNFTAAFYLREIVEDELIKELYLLAYEDAEKNNELWWQIRVLQDLGWDTELNELVLSHRKEINEAEDILLKQVLAKAEGDIGTSDKLIKEEAEQTADQYKKWRKKRRARKKTA